MDEAEEALVALAEADAPEALAETEATLVWEAEAEALWER